MTAAPVRPAPTPRGSPPPADPASALSRQEKTFTLAGVLLALLLAALDQTIVATAGPVIQRDLGIPPSLYVWITTAYLVSSTVMVPIYGKLSDDLGRKPVLLFGVGLFLLGSFLCGIAPNTMTLIAFRAVQGLGAASLFTTAFAVIADLFPPAERGKYSGYVGAVMGVASVVGPLIGGFLTDTLGWHWVFFVNLPIGAVALWFIVTKMPRLGAPPAGRRARPRIDLPGAFWLVTGVVPLLVALSLGRSNVAPGEAGFAWGSWQIVGMFALAAIALVAFVLAERRATDPVLDLRLFRDRTVGLGTAAVFVLGAGFLSAVVFLPLFMVNVVGVSATRAGLTMTPLTLGIVAGSILSGQMVARIGRYKPLLLGSLVVLVAGFAVMAFTLSPASTQGEVTLKMILVGLGVGPSLPLYTLAIQNAAPPEDIGVATAASTFSRSLGQVIGVAFFGTVFAGTLTSAMGRRVEAATAELPPRVRAAVTAEAPVAHAQGEAAGLAFDTTLVKARLRQSAAVGSEALSAATGTDVIAPHEVAGTRAGDAGAASGGARGTTSITPGVPAVGGLTSAERTAALVAVDRVSLAFKQAFTDAISALYRVGIAIVLLGLLLTLFMPELPLRKTNAPGGGRTMGEP